ncbi:MFS transporter [Allorhizobium sp. BGMRC 0089]|uniref:MFS transporter n=1 Tax=Allorhizobium sonneratiae TaxID=2934936 RepID=UPI002033CDCB|nr:MFS transporter [Allorhizobium sonneratiae]MCM2293860.1 MFS transporter [Allorhizobium sonneratiae]
MAAEFAENSRSATLGRDDFKILGLSALGGALEFYDFIIFVFFATAIGKLFFPPDLPDYMVTVQTFAIFATGYLIRPVGGIVIAHFGDMFGRKRVFAFSIFLMALSTLGIAALPPYASIGIAAPLLLLLLRLLQGAAVGGEVPGAWTFVTEHVPSRHVGFACGFLCSGLTLGILLGALIAALLNTLLTPQQMLAYGWRIPFVIGGVFGLCAVYLRQWLRETPVFIRMSRERSAEVKLPVADVLRRHPAAVILSMALTWVLAASLIVTTLMTATLLEKIYHYSAATALMGTSVGTIFLIIGTTGAGALIDRMSSGKFFMLTSPFYAVATFAFYHFAGQSEMVMFVLYAIMGLSVGMVSGVPYVMVRAFPPRVRFSGLSFSYNLSYAIFGGMTPIAVASMLKWSPMAPAYYLLFIAAMAFLLGLYLMAKGHRIESTAGVEEAISSV